MEGRLHLGDCLYRHAARDGHDGRRRHGRSALSGPGHQVRDRRRIARPSRSVTSSTSRSTPCRRQCGLQHRGADRLSGARQAVLWRGLHAGAHGQRLFQRQHDPAALGLPIPRPAAGTKAAGSSRLRRSQQTASGILTDYIAGQKVQITVYQTDTQATVAANLAAAINALTTLPVTAAVDGTDTRKVEPDLPLARPDRQRHHPCPELSRRLWGRAIPSGSPRRRSPCRAAPARRTSRRHLGDPVEAVLPRRHAVQRHRLAADLGRRDGLRPDRPLGLTCASSTAGSTTSAATPTRACSSGGCGQLARHLDRGARAGAPTPCGSSRPATAPRARGSPRRSGTAAADAGARGCLPATVDQQFSQSAAQQPRQLGLAAFGVAPVGQPDDPARADAVPAQPVRPGRHRLRAADDAVEPRRAADPRSSRPSRRSIRATSWPGQRTIMVRVRRS